MKTKETVCIKGIMVGMMVEIITDKVKINITTSTTTMIFITEIMETRKTIEEEVDIMRIKVMTMEEDKDLVEDIKIIITTTICQIINLDIQTTIIHKTDHFKIKRIQIIMILEIEWIIMIIGMIKKLI